MRRVRPAAAALCVGVAAAAAHAQGEPRGRAWRLAPSVAVTEAWSDNPALSAAGSERPGWVTGLEPAIRAELEGARVKAFLDYRLLRTWHSSVPDRDSRQDFLKAFAGVEAVEDRAFVEARADITQENRSAFAPAVTPGLDTSGANRVETRSGQVAPHVRGDLLDIASYRLRVEQAHVRADALELPATSSTGLKGRIGSASHVVKLGWNVDLRAVRLRNDVAGTLDDGHVRASVFYAIFPQLRVAVSEGYDASDYPGPPRQGGHTPGVGVDWMPGVRTRLSALYEQRFFGDSHVVAFSHRTPLTAWRLASTRDATVTPVQLASRDTGSIASLMYEQLASAIPDREERAEAVRRRMDDARIPEGSALSGTVLATRPFVFSETVASFALLGAINTATITAVRREQRGFGVRIARAPGDEDFRQAGTHLNVAHRLTPLTTFTLGATYLRTDSLSGPPRRSTQRHVTASLSTRLGPHTTASVGVRRATFAGASELSSHRETAVFAAVSVRL